MQRRMWWLVCGFGFWIGQDRIKVEEGNEGKNSYIKKRRQLVTC